MFLVVLRRVGIGHEDRGDAARRELGEPRRARAEDGEIRHRLRLRHIVEIGHDLDVRRRREVDARILEARELRLILALARREQELHLRVVLRRLEHADHRAVDGARAAAAARDEHDAAVAREAVGLEAVLAARGQDLAADGIARADGLRRGEVAHGLLRARRNLRDEAGEQLIRDARHDILLLDERRHAREARREQDGPADVAARADGRVGAELAHEARGLADADERLARAAQIVERDVTLEALQVDGRERQSFLRHDVGLEAAPRTDVEELRLRHARLERADDGDGRVDVAARAAARYDDSHASPPLSAVSSLTACGSARTSRLKSRPRCAMPSYISKLAQAGESSTTSPACAQACASSTARGIE